MLCVIAKIDDISREKLSRLCSVAEEFGFPPRHLHGHITLVSYVGMNENEFVERCKTILADLKAFFVDYDRIEILSPTPSIVVSPICTRQLSAVHDSLVSIAPAEMDFWSSEINWYPHTTLFYHSAADLKAISKRMRTRFSPLTARVEEIEFSRVTEQGYEIVDSVKLKDDSNCRIR